MREMADLGTLILGVLTKWNLEHYILLRIRVLMGFLMVMYYVILTLSMSDMGRTNGLRAMDAVSDTLLVYVMGAMQAASFKNKHFPVWALMLVSFRSSVNFKSKYDTSFEVKNMLKLWGMALLSVRHCPKLWRTPFWLFWSVMVIKSLYRIRAHKLASKSLLHGRSSELVHEYMASSNIIGSSDFNPEAMQGKYLVFAEKKKGTMNGHSGISINDLRSVTTLEKIWQQNGLMFPTFSIRKNSLRVLTLAFPLYRLLRCRLEGGKLHVDTISMTNQLICSLIGADDAEKVLTSILQLHLLFLKLHLHTGYPVMFCMGLRSICFPAVLCLVKYISIVWLYPLELPPKNTDTYLTLIATVFIMAIDCVITCSYITSCWTILLLVCNYVNCSNNCMKRVLEKMISHMPLVPEPNRVKYSSRYDFLRSSKYREGKLKPVAVTFQFIKEQCVPKNYTNKVMARVFRALARCMDSTEDRHLPRDSLPWPRASARVERYWSACLELPGCSHVILVWHIATSLCQVKLEKDRGNTNSTGLSRLFVGNTMPDLAGNLSKANTVANCLSRYCLHLLISKPNLLPENVFTSKKLLLDTIQHAHDILRGCNSPQSRYDAPIALSQEAAAPAGSQQDIELTGNILIQGAMMGKELIDNEDEEGRWEILAEVWADILVQISPSSKAEAHGKGLQFGTELVTLVWALLCHCGIEKSELWPEER